MIFVEKSGSFAADEIAFAGAAAAVTLAAVTAATVAGKRGGLSCCCSWSAEPKGQV